MDDIKFILKRKENETWYECAIRHAEDYDMAIEVQESYELFMEQGMDEAHAALHACYEWDVLPINKTIQKVIKMNI